MPQSDIAVPSLHANILEGFVNRRLQSLRKDSSPDSDRVRGDFIPLPTRFSHPQTARSIASRCSCRPQVSIRASTMATEALVLQKEARVGNPARASFFSD